MPEVNQKDRERLRKWRAMGSENDRPRDRANQDQGILTAQADLERLG